MTPAPVLPGPSNRTLVLGRTGAGKSQFSLYLLMLQNWDKMPWVMIDYKGDELIEVILATNKGKIKHIKPTDKPPTKPGLYYMHPRPILDDAAMEEWLMQVWRNGRTGLFIDEGYALPDMGKTAAFTLILTQGRTLNIPCIYLYQRPVFMSRFAVPQSDFRAVFAQSDDRDEKVIASYCRPAILPNGKKLGPMDLDNLPKYHCLWHDVSQGRTFILSPAPSRDTILNHFHARLSVAQHHREFV